MPAPSAYCSTAVAVALALVAARSSRCLRSARWWLRGASFSDDRCDDCCPLCRLGGGFDGAADETGPLRCPATTAASTRRGPTTPEAGFGGGFATPSSANAEKRWSGLAAAKVPIVRDGERSGLVTTASGSILLLKGAQAVLHARAAGSVCHQCHARPGRFATGVSSLLRRHFCEPCLLWMARMLKRSLRLFGLGRSLDLGARNRSHTGRKLGAISFVGVPRPYKECRIKTTTHSPRPPCKSVKCAKPPVKTTACPATPDPVNLSNARKTACQNHRPSGAPTTPLVPSESSRLVCLRRHPWRP